MGDLIQVDQADVTDEMNKGGPSFGAFMKAVGMSVAETQAKLDDTFVATAKVLSSTEIEVIAVFEQQLKDDDGTMDKGDIQMQKLPLINYLMPTALQYKTVHLQADMDVKEFTSKSGFNIDNKTQNASVGGGLSFGAGGFGGAFGGGYSSQSSNQSGAFVGSQGSAAGSLHMDATIEPRPDIRLPQPFILQKGPSLSLSEGSATDITGPVPTRAPAGSPAPVIGRQMVLTATLNNTDGSANTGKTLVVR